MVAIYARDVTKDVESREQPEEKKRDLESKTELLGDANMALKTMLQKSKENREEIEAEVMATLKKMVVPLVLAAVNYRGICPVCAKKLYPELDIYPETK